MPWWGYQQNESPSPSITVQDSEEVAVTTAPDSESVNIPPLCPTEKRYMNCNRAILEVRFSYFRPSSELLRKIYDNGGINYELTASLPVWRRLNIWEAVDYFSKDGRSLGGHQKTEIRIIPLTLGLKYIYDIKKFSLYGGLGFRYFFVHVKNHSESVDRSISENGLGGVVEAGIMYQFLKHWVADVFGSYSFKELHTHTSRDNVKTHSLEVGGWNVGGGIGCKF